jgi:hypothetical protein
MRRYGHMSVLMSLGCLLLAPLSCENENQEVIYRGIAGIYSCQETSAHSGMRKYIVEIDRVREKEDLFIISNFHNAGENEFLYAEFDHDTLRIENQVISHLSVNGHGMVSEGFRIIDLRYKTDDGITILDYSATFTR